jgi:hypothetical protein
MTCIPQQDNEKTINLSQIWVAHSKRCYERLAQKAGLIEERLPLHEI